MAELPTGTVTFLFTDLESSTRLWEEHPEAMRAASARHDGILRGAVEAAGGQVVKTTGDGFHAVFAAAEDAVKAAVEAQRGLSREAWSGTGPLRVRMGLHTGTAQYRSGDYFGSTLNRAARLMSVAHGGQTVVSLATGELVRDRLPAAVTLVDLGEHRLRDLSRPERVFQVGEGVFPPLRSVDAVPTNLPTVRTELIGRTDDVTTLMALVEGQRCVTLTGVGGVGKTRLALGVAAALAAGFADGCWLVELAPVTGGDEVVKVVAAAMRSPVTDIDALATYLSERRVLIVLDNCEHVLDAVAELVDTITAAPDVHVLVTSREPLGLEGEQVRRVQSLDVPDLQAPVDEARSVAAVRLFTERAAAASGGFTLDADNVAPVVEICRHLDGIPLAIELAAARVRAMPPEEIARRLDERFRLLAGGSRRAQERHRTLLATVSWSHDLLSEDERITFRRLSVFPASFDLAAAEAVAGHGVADVVNDVLHLVDRSLVVYEPNRGRYRLLETLRQYGADRLTEAGETDDTRERHADYFLGLAERLAPELADARYPAAHATLVADLDNLRAVAEWCNEGGRWTDLARMAHELWIFLMQAAAVDGASWLQQLIEHPDDLDPQTLADALAEMAYLAAVNLADYPNAFALAERSLSVTDRDNVLPAPWAWLAKTLATFWTAPEPEGLHACERALAVAEARHDESSAIIAIGQLANWYTMLGDSESGARASAEALRRAEQSGHPPSVQSGVVLAATNCVFTGAPDFNASLAILARHDTGPSVDNLIAMWLDIIWGATLVGLHRTDAITRLIRGIDIADRQGAPSALDLALRLLAIAVADAGHRPEAATLLGYCDAHLGQHRFQSPVYQWVWTRLNDALAGTTDRAVHEAAGAASTRRTIMALVTRVDSLVGAEGVEPATSDL